MLLKNFNTVLILSLFYKASVIATTFKFQINDEQQPFVVNIEFYPDGKLNERQYELSAPPPNSSDNAEIEYVSNTSTTSKNLLISTCPFEGKNNEFPNMLYQNQENETTCSGTFRPSILSQNGKKIYGANKNATKYSVGYWVNWTNPTQENMSYSVNGGFNSLKNYNYFVSFYDVFYYNQHSSYFTKHTIHPGTEISLDSWIIGRETALFKSYIVNYPTHYDKSLIQLVPFEDLIPMPWKIGTLLNINFISVEKSTKKKLIMINKCLRSYVNNTKIPLTVFSGVWNNAWYWKIVVSGEQGVMISIVNQNEENYLPPCEAGHCGEFGLEKLEEKISNFFCCEVTQWMAETLNLVSYETDSEPDYLVFEEKLVLSPVFEADRSQLVELFKSIIKPIYS